jgi:hypothetical protein
LMSMSGVVSTMMTGAGRKRREVDKAYLCRKMCCVVGDSAWANRKGRRGKAGRGGPEAGSRNVVEDAYQKKVDWL